MSPPQSAGRSSTRTEGNAGQQWASDDAKTFDETTKGRAAAAAQPSRLTGTRAGLNQPAVRAEGRQVARHVKEPDSLPVVQQVA